MSNIWFAGLDLKEAYWGLVKEFKRYKLVVKIIVRRVWVADWRVEEGFGGIVEKVAEEWRSWIIGKAT